VANARKFDQLSQHCKKDLTALRYAARETHPLPKFHYETRRFSIVQSCTDLSDSELELTIVRGISYSCPNPKDIDTYIKYDFAYPKDSPVSGKTPTIKDTNNPEYNTKVVFPIKRKDRAFERFVKRHAIKFEVWVKGGFLRGDSIFATAQAKLEPLESKCIVHDSYDLMDGRKPCGGKLEVRMRIRDPLCGRQIEEMTEKWLVIDQFHGKMDTF